MSWILTSPISSISTRGSLSGLKDLNVTCSFPVEIEQHELDPDSNGADEMMTDETPFEDENGGDCDTVVRKPVS